MALSWLYAVDPMRQPLLFGDVVLSGDESDGDVPEEPVRDVFEATAFFIDVRARTGRLWRETRAQFGTVFEAAVWCTLQTRSARPGVQFRICPHVLSSN